MIPFPIPLPSTIYAYFWGTLYSSLCTHLPGPPSSLYSGTITLLRPISKVPMTFRETRQERRHMAIAHRWCALNIDIHSQFSFQTSLTWSGNETIHYTSATWETRRRASTHMLELKAAWVLEDKSGERETQSCSARCFESMSRHSLSFPVTADSRSQCTPSFAVSSSEVSHNGLRTLFTKFVQSSMFTWFHFSPRDFFQLDYSGFSGRPPHTTTTLQFP